MPKSRSKRTWEKYEYDNGFQEKILSMMLKDPAFLNEYGDVVQPTFFTDLTNQSIARYTLLYYNTYGKRPTNDALRNMITTHCKKFDIEEDEIDDVLSALAHLYEDVDLEDSEFVKDRAVDFGQYQAARLLLLNLADYVEDYKLNAYKRGEKFNADAILPLVHRAISVGKGRDPGVNVFDYLENPSKLRESDGISDPMYRVRSGFPTLDRILKGGLGGGELAVVMGESGIGKSMFLNNIAASAVLYGKKTIYITFELKPYEVAIRVLARMLGRKIDDVEAADDSYQRALDRIRKIGSKYFRIKYFKPSEATIGNVRSYLCRLEHTDGITPQLMVIDYLDEMKGAEEGRYRDVNETYHTFGKLCEGLIEMGVDYKCPVWTATQIKREFYGVDPTLGAVGESMKKVNKADLVVALAQTDNDLRSRRMRIKLLKIRRAGGKGRYIKCVTFFKKAMLREVVSEKTRYA